MGQFYLTPMFSSAPFSVTYSTRCCLATAAGFPTVWCGANALVLATRCVVAAQFVWLGRVMQQFNAEPRPSGQH